MTKAEIEGKTLDLARAHGCACDVEIEVIEVEPMIFKALVRHDDWCPLLRAREDRN